MPKEFPVPPPRINIDSLPVPERIKYVRRLLAEEKLALETGDRELAAQLSRRVFASLVKLNKERRTHLLPLRYWNPEGDLTEAEFDQLKSVHATLAHNLSVKLSTSF